MAKMTRENILEKLKKVKSRYEGEGIRICGLFGSYARNQADETSDIDILIEATPRFAQRYGFEAIARLREIEEELSRLLGRPVDLADRSGMGKTAHKFIVKRTLYV